MTVWVKILLYGLTVTEKKAEDFEISRFLLNCITKGKFPGLNLYVFHLI